MPSIRYVILNSVPCLGLRHKPLPYNNPLWVSGGGLAGRPDIIVDLTRNRVLVC